MCGKENHSAISSRSRELKRKTFDWWRTSIVSSGREDMNGGGSIRETASGNCDGGNTEGIAEDGRGIRRVKKKGPKS